MFLSISDKNLLIIIISLAFLLVLFACLLFIKLKRNSKKSYVNKVDHLFSLVSVEANNLIKSYLTRLSKIASKNEDYEQIYLQMNNQFEKLEKEDYEKICVRYNGLRNRVLSEKKVNKNLLEQVKSFENLVNIYVNEMNQIKKDLQSYFKEGDELRIVLTSYQEQYRKIVEEKNKNSSVIGLCKNEIEEYLSDIEMYFDIFEDNILAAKYKEAANNLNEIKEKINGLFSIETIAEYCKMVDTLIPNQLEDLLNKNEELNQKGIVVSHSNVKEFVINANNELERCKKEFKKLNFTSFESVNDAIQSKLADAHAYLDNEVFCQKSLDEKYDSVNLKVQDASTSFIKTKRQFMAMIEIYRLPENVHDRFINFQNQATQLSDLYRNYQTFLFNTVKIPSSIMLEKLLNMNEVADNVLDNINYFSKLFNDIKVYVESTYNQTDKLMIDLTTTLANVRYHKCKVVFKHYFNDVKDEVKQLKEIKDLLLKKPINYEEIYPIFSPLVEKVNDTIDSINIELKNYQMVEKCIIFANSLRHKFNDVDKQLSEIELLFKDGDYKLAQDKLNNILSNYHSLAYGAFKE